ncbi:hypothetical protein [Donghicola tyrosinivorans]|uniref:Uncharacterized protein n=1 Tax=Donghicola tyrosinivorans TaxID=1652492 RepID=A0A2T0WIA4_9RHOB|nr:hypothetical protein [Donghicola tyrosinivorans]PRY86392.1 hypothetical protein CLV74_11231 [Donghicola tyrosinivorans]
MRTGAYLAFVASVAASQVNAFDGLYKQSANADCSLVGVDGGALKIEGAQFIGVENKCEMTLPVDVNEMDARLYTMQCEGANGPWSARAMLVHAADGGLIMVWDGYAFKYDRCPEDVTKASSDGVVSGSADVMSALPDDAPATEVASTGETSAQIDGAADAAIDAEATPEPPVAATEQGEG